MKIQISGGKRSVSIKLPTRMLFSKTVLRLIRFADRYHVGDALDGIPVEAMDAIFSELRRTKERHGSWLLVDVESADGQKVKIIL